MYVEWILNMNMLEQLTCDHMPWMLIPGVSTGGELLQKRLQLLTEKIKAELTDPLNITGMKANTCTGFLLNLSHLKDGRPVDKI